MLLLAEMPQGKKEKTPENGAKSKDAKLDAVKAAKDTKGKGSVRLSKSSKEDKTNQLKRKSNDKNDKPKKRQSSSQTVKSPKPPKAKKLAATDEAQDSQVEEELLDYEDNLNMSQDSLRSVEGTRDQRMTRSKSKERNDQIGSPKQGESAGNKQGSMSTNENARPDSGSELDSSSSSSSDSSSSPSSSDSDEEVEKRQKRRSKKRKRKRKSNKSDFVTMLKVDFQTYVQKAIADTVQTMQKQQQPQSAEHNASKNTESFGLEEADNSIVSQIGELSVEAASSETTIYSQLVKPPESNVNRPTVMFRSPTKPEETINNRESDESAMETSDEINFSLMNSSDEMADNTVPPLSELRLPPPPRGPETRGEWSTKAASR